MVGFGTIINVAGIIIGGILGRVAGRFLSERYQDSLSKACGISVLFIGIAGVLEEMMTVSESQIVSGKSMLIVVCLTLGALTGEFFNLENGIEKFGEWLKIKTGNAKEKSFVEGFVTASLTVCIGAMAIVGSIEDGIFGDYSILATKAVLDLVIVLVMTCSLGKGCAFSAIPVAVFQGTITVLAKFIKPLMAEAALSNLSLIGSILIFCVGINLVWGKKIRVANFLPAIIVAVMVAFLPVGI
ncbi:MAG: DUF554 domain-containing protein [Lachnospiraceae bacterium]|nr:DUF554 domain-containing protein [Lachnospiraceae bacterium]